jgi:chemotaxis methyl-accepting protein methylase
LKACPPNGTLRAWSLGCSTGEEAYSLAIAFKETVAQLAPESGIKLRVFATDLDKDAIDKARHGLYPPESPRMFPPNGWTAFSCRTHMATGSARRSGR